MPKRESHKVGSELFIVDNSAEEWKAVRYLRDWCQLSKAIDIASGFFEIGALLALAGEWQKVDKIRILMGDEVSKRTKRAFEVAFSQIASRLKIFSHTDLMREKLQDELDQVRAQADVIIIDEAHHFRNTGIRGLEGKGRPSRYWRMRGS